MPIQDINFDAFVEEKEAQTEDFKSFYSELNNITQRFLKQRLDRNLFQLLCQDMKQLTLEYAESHPDTSFKIRPEHEYAYEEQSLTAYQIAELHDKFYDYHHPKDQYTYLDVQNMLFDLHNVGQVSFAEDMSKYKFSSICDKTINVAVRVYDYFP